MAKFTFAFQYLFCMNELFKKDYYSFCFYGLRLLLILFMCTFGLYFKILRLLTDSVCCWANIDLFLWFSVKKQFCDYYGFVRYKSQYRKSILRSFQFVCTCRISSQISCATDLFFIISQHIAILILPMNVYEFQLKLICFSWYCKASKSTKNVPYGLLRYMNPKAIEFSASSILLSSRMKRTILRNFSNISILFSKAPELCKITPSIKQYLDSYRMFLALFIPSAKIVKSFNFFFNPFSILNEETMLFHSVFYPSMPQKSIYLSMNFGILKKSGSKILSG